MFSKIVAILAFAAISSAQYEDHHGATSYASSKSYNTHTSHDAPSVVKYDAPLATYHAPVHSYQHAPVHSYYHAPVQSYHHSPIVHLAAPATVKPVHHEVDHNGHAKYQFKYGVHDPHTHDIKNQEESRDGDVVKGFYSLLQPDGRTRVVHYSADHHNGFQAHVEYSGHAGHPEVHHKALIAAPAYYHH